MGIGSGVAAYGAAALASSLGSVSASKAIGGAVGGLAAQYAGDVATNIANGSSGSNIFAPRSSGVQYGISALTVGGTSVIAPTAGPLLVGSISGASAFVQDRVAGQPVSVGGLANNAVNGLGAGLTQGAINGATGIPGRLPNANTTADFIGAHAIAGYTSQAISAAGQFITSAVASLIHENK